MIVGRDVTQYKILQSQLVQAQKLESIGQLAAGIAHEINTPTQYVSDNVFFLEESFRDILALLDHYQNLSEMLYSRKDPSPVLDELKILIQQIDMEFLRQEIPKALDQSREGLTQVAKIVRSIKEFAHPGTSQKVPLDINHAVLNTITVSRNEWKYVAEMVTDLDEQLPMVPCLPGEFNQAVLNVIMNAAQAIGEVVGDGSEKKGRITVKTALHDHMAEISIEDTGPGILNEYQDRIFDPFFTTKEVGKGTGQGLSIVHGIIVQKHQGQLIYNTEPGKGTTFLIRLPLGDQIRE